MSDRQPPPKPGRTDVLPLVVADLQARAAVGLKTYGTPLQTHNGRDALRDAYEEALDLCMYLRQEMEQREDLRARIDAQPAASAVSSFDGPCQHPERNGRHEVYLIRNRMVCRACGAVKLSTT